MNKGCNGNNNSANFPWRHVVSHAPLLPQSLLRDLKAGECHYNILPPQKGFTHGSGIKQRQITEVMLITTKTFNLINQTEIIHSLSLYAVVHWETVALSELRCKICDMFCISVINTRWNSPLTFVYFLSAGLGMSFMTALTWRWLAVRRKRRPFGSLFARNPRRCSSLGTFTKCAPTGTATRQTPSPSTAPWARRRSTRSL